MIELAELQQKMHYKFNNIELLETALTHSSFANECAAHCECNERLEFLGDSVLGFIAAEYYFTSRKSRPEGDLTKLRAACVCEKSLFGFAKQLDLGDYIRLGKGEIHSGGSERPSILADAFEAVIAAVYLDGGMPAAKKYVLSFIRRADTAPSAFSDFKSVLQEVVQQNPGERLEYVLTGENGPDHEKVFTVEVHLNSNVFAVGEGRSKKLAEQEAAKQALMLMGLL